MTVINTALASLEGQFHLSRSHSTLKTAMERLSSGLRVNSASDDAAGQATGNRLLAQSTGLDQSARNANDGISLSQTTQGSLDNINDKLQRIRELTVQALNETLSTADSDAIQAEINQNLEEIDRLAATTEYNGIPLMNGKAGKVSLQVGANDGQTLGVDLGPPGFSAEALGLDGLNIAGITGSTVERNTLEGRARDIPLYDADTALSFSAGTQQPLYYSSSVGYYTDDGAGGFSRVSVSASHETATDASTVNINNPRPIFDSNLETDPEPFPPLPAGQRLLDVDGTMYLEERLGDGSLSYSKVDRQLSYNEVLTPAVTPGGTPYMSRSYPATVTLSSGPDETGSYTPVADTFTLSGDTYSLNDATNVNMQYADGSALPGGELVEDGEGNLYLYGGSSGTERYYRLDNVDTHDRLVVTSQAMPTIPDVGDTFVEVLDSFFFGGESYVLSDFDSQQFSKPGATLVENQDGDLFLRTGSDPLNYEYFNLVDVTAERDLTLQADSQGFTGIDLQSADELSAPEIPATDFTSFGAVSFQGADFSGMSNLTLVQRTTTDGQWMIRGELADGSLGYFEADLDMDFAPDGSLTAVTATATESDATVLGAASHERDKVSGYSTITIDPRNVTVDYTDLDGDTFTDVLRENEDGNYYFNLTADNDSPAGYKTATLVDLEGTTEVVLKTLNGNHDVVVYYPSNVNMGYNLSVVAQTDADGFSNDGVPHTRLSISETGPDFRLKVPQNPLAAIDRAIGMVDAKRGLLGATENRLESVIETNNITSTNLSAARSRIMDADYAAEVSNLTRSQILQQAGTSVMAQANQMPQNVLSLLS